MKWITPVLVLIMIAAVVGISGCTDTGASAQQTYSNGSIKFNYSNDYQTATPPGKLSSGPTSWIDVTFLANSNGTAIEVEKNNQVKDPSVAREATDAFTDSTSGVSMSNVSHTTETNPNGIKIFKSTYTLKDSDGTVKYIDIYFKDKQGIVYCISVFNVESSYQDVSDTANTIFNSLSLN